MMTADDFTRAYESCAPQLLRGLMRIFNDADEARDVLHEAILQAWRDRHRFDADRGSGGAWLHTIARTRALDRLRRLASQRNGRSRLALPMAITERPTGGLPFPNCAAPSRCFRARSARSCRDNSTTGPRARSPSSWASPSARSRRGCARRSASCARPLRSPIRPFSDALSEQCSSGTRAGCPASREQVDEAVGKDRQRKQTARIRQIGKRIG